MNESSHTYRRCVMDGNPCTMRCSRCESAYYCCKKCQVQDWKESHKSKCGKDYDGQLDHAAIKQHLRSTKGGWSVELARIAPHLDINSLRIWASELILEILQSYVLHGLDMLRIQHYECCAPMSLLSSLALAVHARRSHSLGSMQWILRHDAIIPHLKELAPMLYDHSIVASQDYIRMLIEAGVYPPLPVIHKCEQRRDSGDWYWDSKRDARLRLLKNVRKSSCLMIASGEWRPWRAQKYPELVKNAIFSLVILAKC